ncbi:hypothetical protein [Modestobacter sp. Leaf380]|uniref:hypothetical protein n=1 Tax=Modestobacter sp. Leaf380 TaxID=1736356 RepID=UPI0006F8D47F|nr:hypothetical protein [Modestobacter sp. Leaf380]KQS66518.1 hypothetical protein ASG41_08430 [Modestobacter sp. Leaf380]
MAAKAADASGVGWLADLGSHPAAWVLAVALLARAAPTGRLAAVGSAVFFAVMSLAYYAFAVVVLGFDLRGQLVLLAAWTVLSLTAVPLFAVVVHLATRHRGVLPGAVLAGAAALALADRTLWELWLAATGDAPGVLHPVQAVAGVVVALVVAGVLPRHGRTRAVALVLLAPAAVAATWGVDLLYGLLPG